MSWITALKTNLLSAIKSKALSVLCIILITALTISFVTGVSDRNELSELRVKVVNHAALNEKLSAQNIELLKEIKNKPVEYVTITKEVDSQVCDGTVSLALINAIKSTKEQDHETDEINTVDIDAKLPTDLIQLLK